MKRKLLRLIPLIAFSGLFALTSINNQNHVFNVAADNENLIEDGDYFITDFSGSHVLAPNLLDAQNNDFNDSSLLWTIKNTGLDVNTYSISNSNEYLFHNPSIKKSSLDLSNDSSKYWVVSKNNDDSFSFSYSETGNDLSSAPGLSSGDWFAFATPSGTQNHIKLLKCGEFESFEIEKLPTTKQYFVGETLKPLNCKINAVFDNGAKVDITNQIVWETLTEGTKAYGKVVIGDIERVVEMDGIQVYKGDASTFVISGLEDSYLSGEKINKDNLEVSIIYKLSGYSNIEKTLSKDDYVISPEVIEDNTNKIKVSLAKDPTVFVEKEISIRENIYVATPHVFEGDIVVIGTLGYDPYSINGGVELDYVNGKFSYDTFGYLPYGNVKFEVNKVGSYYTLKDINTGYYLKGDNSTLGFNKPDLKSVYKEADGHYEFNLNVNIAGSDYLVTMETDNNPDFSYSNVFYSLTYANGYEDYIVGTSDLDNKILTFEYWSKTNGYVEPYDVTTIKLAYCLFNNGVFQYSIETSSTLPEECLFLLNYDEDFEEWIISSKPHTDKQLYFNKDGKFGFYPCGSTYTPVMLFRDNTLPLKSEVNSLSISFVEGMDSVRQGEPFPWTSSLIVRANYVGGASKIIPVGGYQITMMPDTTKIGTSTGKISYGQISHQIEKEFKIIVNGNTQAFVIKGDKDPVLVGEECQLRVEPSAPEGEPISWSVDAPELASISNTGLLKGLAPGYVYVTATSYDGAYSDTVKIRIYQQVESVTLNVHELTLEVGEVSTLIATVSPNNASNPNVEFSSSDIAVASVNKKTGEILAIAPGTSIITCAAQNHPERNYDTCIIKVNEKEKIHVSGVTLDLTTAYLNIGESLTLHASISPSDAENKDVVWTSSNDDVAIVTNGTINAISEGSATIYVETVDGSYKASCFVTVSLNVISVTDISLNHSSLTLLVGDMAKLTATISPTNATDKSIHFSSSNEEIVSVDQNGNLIALKEGSSLITAKSGNCEAFCEVKVNKKEAEVINVESIHLDTTNVDLNVGETFTFTVTINPSDATNKEVTWTSTNQDIVSIDQNGVAKGLKEGSATIKVTSLDGSKIDTATVNVKKINNEQVNEDTEEGFFDKIVSFFKNPFGCFGSVTSTSLIVTFASIIGIGLVILRKKKMEK